VRDGEIMGSTNNDFFKEDKVEFIKRQEKEERPASRNKKNMNYNSNRTNTLIKNIIKKPGLKTGIGLAIIGIICLSIINFLPWLYIKYDSETTDEGVIEDYYYKNLRNDNPETHDQDINDFFDNSETLTGVSKNDFVDKPAILNYIFILIIVIGLIYLMMGVITESKIPIKNNLIFQTISILFVVFLCTYAIYICLNFLASHLLLYNIQQIQQLLPKVIMVFPAPIILIIFSAVLIKFGFSILEIKFGDLAKINDWKNKNLNPIEYPKWG
jgi:hypothetical protein